MSNKGLHLDGYDKEEQYFAALNNEKRKALNEAKEEQKKCQAKELHWMKCPKCGSDMEEIPLEGILIDKCTNCKGIYFDDGELELLLQQQEPKGILSSIKSFFS